MNGHAWHNSKRAARSCETAGSMHNVTVTVTVKLQLYNASAEAARAEALKLVGTKCRWSRMKRFKLEALLEDPPRALSVAPPTRQKAPVPPR